MWTSYLCWLFIWSNCSLRSLSSACSCCRFDEFRLDRSLPGWELGALRPGCSAADRAFGNREEKDSAASLLASAACREREEKKINISCLNTPRGQVDCFSFLTGAAPLEFSFSVEDASCLFSSITSGACNLSLVSEILLVQKQTIKGNLEASEAWGQARHRAYVRNWSGYLWAAWLCVYECACTSVSGLNLSQGQMGHDQNTPHILLQLPCCQIKCKGPALLEICFSNVFCMHFLSVPRQGDFEVNHPPTLMRGSDNLLLSLPAWY